eukprot:4132378-Karenia_brevis.AAC.1
MQEFTRAMIVLTSSGLAQGNEETLHKVRARPVHQEAPIPEVALSQEPLRPFKLEQGNLMAALR